jgi:hypothetical protein
MHRESALGRALWIALLVLLCGYVVADFVRSPFLAPSGSAAVRPVQVTIWTGGGESGDETGTLVRDTAAALELAGHPTAVKSIRGGSSQAVAEFLSRPPVEPGDVMAVTSATLADLAHDRRDRLVPGAAEEAALARALLRRAIPIGLVGRDALAIGVSPGEAIDNSDELVAALARAPWERVFGIPDDTWSRTQLASLVERAGVNGSVRFSVYQSGAEAGQELAAGTVNTILVPRGSLWEDARKGRLRTIRWPFDQGRAPRFWVGLVAAPGTSPARVAQLRRWLSAMAREPAWRRSLRRSGHEPTAPGSQELAILLRDGMAKADRLELLTQRVESR